MALTLEDLIGKYYRNDDLVSSDVPVGRRNVHVSAGQGSQAANCLLGSRTYHTLTDAMSPSFSFETTHPFQSVADRPTQWVLSFLAR